MSKITIAIPTYNRQDYLYSCINSIINQSFQDWQIIIFDNNSNFNINEFCNSFKDSRIKCDINKANIGNLNNFRKIFNYQFDSEYLVVFHDDDAMHPKFLDENLRFMDNHTNMVLAASLANFVKDHKQMNRFIDFDKINSIILNSPDELVKLICKDFDLCFGSVVYRTKFLEDSSSCIDKFSKWFDRPYLVNLSKKGTIGIIKNKMVNYRIHSGQDSQVSNDNLNKMLDIIGNLFSYYKDILNPLDAKDKKVFYSFSTNNIINIATTQANTLKKFFYIISRMKQKKIFNVYYLNWRGLYYIFKSLFI